MTINWKHIVCGGGLLVALRHVGFAIGFAAQVIAEGFVDGVRARAAVHRDAANITPGTVFDEFKKDVHLIRDKIGE